MHTFATVQGFVINIIESAYLFFIPV